jgi:hypothetical protein
LGVYLGGVHMIEREQIITRLCTLGYAATENDNPLIDYLIDSVYQSVLNETNCDEMPEGLKFVAIDMVCGQMLTSKLANNQIDVEQAVTSIREGDTSVSYADGGDPKEFLKTYYSNLIHNKQLYKYRKLVW